METWKECGWGKCGKRFEPAKYNNQHRGPDSKHKRHKGAIYCSRGCQQKAYRWRLEASQKTVQASRKPAPHTDVPATVTRPLEPIENIEVFWTKIDHPRPYFEAGWKREGGSYLLFGADRLLASVKPDQDYPGLWRVHLPDGHITDMANLTRAKDAALSLAEYHQPNK
jgi:hypothetical protein